jgi:hypothetical protein
MSLIWHLLTPSVPLHEMTHAAAALPWADDLDADLSRDTAQVEVTFDEGTPIWAVYLHSLAPTIVGLGLLLLVVALFGVPTVGTLTGLAVHELGLLVILGLNWVIYSFPSAADRRPLS